MLKEADKLTAALERISYLQKENEQLRQEVFHLKTQISLFQTDTKSILSKKLQSSVSCSNNYLQQKQKGDDLAVDSLSPRPPPKPSASLLLSTTKISEKASLLPPPPPPPPPPPLQKIQGGVMNAVRRVPEVVEFYRTLTRREGKPEARTGCTGVPLATNTREMIGEIENKSAYLSAIKSDVETKGEFIQHLRTEVENATFKDISDVENFVKWLDKELSYLVDERAVLKHFPEWPEKKADTMREAACGYRDLKNLQAEVSSFRDDSLQSTPIALKQIQALQDKLEHGVHSVEKVRESAVLRYRDFRIPWDWMLDTGIIAQLKLGSMKLAKLHMNRVVSHVQSDRCSEDLDNLMLQSVRFAFRVHQFAGGFDGASKHAFAELRKLASKSCE